jgi:hypothetical protein
MRKKYPYCAMCGVEYDNVESANRCCQHLFYHEKSNELVSNLPGNYSDEQILSVIEEIISTHQTLKHKSFLIRWLRGFSTIKSPQAQERLKASRKHLPDSSTF